MFSKIIFVLATVCVINASVLTANVFDDDPATALASNPKDCNFQACDQLCRRLKFSDGACVNGRCKCDKFLKAEDGVSERSLSNVENPVSQQDDPEAEVAASRSKCNHKACDLVCRWLKKGSGSCVNGRCTCAKSFVAKDTMTDSVESLPLSSCNSIACDDKCRRTGWHSGVCIKGQCKCDHFLNTEEDSVSPRKCTHQECNALCHRLKFREGVCIAGRCSCNNYFPKPKDTMNNLEESISLDKNFLGTEDVVSDESLPVSELSEDQTERGCNKRVCDQLCRRLKLPSGTCVNGRCKCANFSGTEDAVDEYSEFAPRRICRLPKCNRTCTRRGYEVAKCVNGRCKCYNKTQAGEDQTARGCNMRACDQLCRKLKLRGGACVNGRCKCDNFFGTEDEYSELATRRICQLRQCNRTCTRRGYESARCVNGWCKCYNKIQRQDAPLNDVTSDENEESNDIGTNEVPSPSACNAVNCNQMCRRLKYAGGWCSKGQCRCY